ncbi:MAG: hypothetical protein OXM56_11125 [Gammaproteobacteria bacterium]|nr:hypothetical protein [Gammaproteobacteria bacterium]
MPARGRALAVLYALGARVRPEDAPAVFAYVVGLAYARATAEKRDDAKAVASFRVAAELGHAAAQLELGMMYAEGRGIAGRSPHAVFDLCPYVEARTIAQLLEDDPECWVHWLRKAADQGLVDAQFELGSTYGEFAEASDYDKPEDAEVFRGRAFGWNLRAALQGHVEAQFRVARYLENEDDEQAAYWYREAAAQGHDRAQLALGRMYSEGRGVDRDRDAALHWWSEAAQRGNREAQVLVYVPDDIPDPPKVPAVGPDAWFGLGVLHAAGDVVEEDPAAAIRWFERAAHAGDAWAQFNLGYLLDQRIERMGVVDREPDEGFYWFRRAAQQGLAQAQCVAGLHWACHRLEAVHWLQRAAEQDLPIAQAALAFVYEEGRLDVTRDFGATMFWLRKAAAQGDMDAQFRLAWNIEYVLWNVAGAVPWYRRAAEQGDAEAQNHMGRLFEHGHIGRGRVARARAFAWYSLSSLQGHPDARRSCRRIRRAASVADLERALQASDALRARLAVHGRVASGPPAVEVPPERRFDIALLGALIERGTVTVGDRVLLHAASGEPLDPWTPLPNPFPLAVWRRSHGRTI